MSKIFQGHIDRESGQPCGWANATMRCSVPGCKFSDERCILVQRERNLVTVRVAPDHPLAEAITRAAAEA